MLIWRGWGILAVVIGFGALLATQFIVDAVAGRGTYSENSEQFAGPAVALAGLLVFFLGRWLNDPSRGRVLVDKETGQEIVDKPRNDLFFIPMEIWGALLVVLGIGWFVSGLLT